MEQADRFSTCAPRSMDEMLAHLREHSLSSTVFATRSDHVRCALLQQGDLQFVTPAATFHKIELCRRGRHDGVCEHADGRLHLLWRPGHIFYVPPGDGFSAEIEGRIESLQVLIDDKLFDDLAIDLFERRFCELNVPRFSGRHNALLRELCEVMLAALRTGTGGRLFVEAVGLQIAHLVVATANDARRANAAATLSPDRLAAAKAFVEAMLGTPIGVEDIAAAARLSPFHFARAFKAATGQSPHQYVLDRRLEAARVRLETTADRLADIAYACGFSSQAHMTATFSKRLGITPGAYRKSIRTVVGSA